MEFFGGYLLIATRVGAFMLTAPMFASKQIPLTVRLGIALLVATAVTAKVSSGHTFVVMGELPTLLLREVLLGTFLGGGVSLLFSATGYMGGILSSMAGLSWGNEQTNEPQSEPAARLLWGVAIAIFLLSRGPESLVLGICDSFQQIPVGTQILAERQLGALGVLVQQTFWLALQGIGPAVAAYLGGVVALGAMSRVLPQFNLFFSGMNVNVILFWCSLFLVVCGGMWALQEDVSSLTVRLTQSLTP
ncbi:MAG: flagellar biosynthetic protein FliR [Pirellulaceae bacterium]